MVLTFEMREESSFLVQAAVLENEVAIFNWVDGVLDTVDHQNLGARHVDNFVGHEREAVLSVRFQLFNSVVAKFVAEALAEDGWVLANVPERLSE